MEELTVTAGIGKTDSCGLFQCDSSSQSTHAAHRSPYSLMDRNETGVSREGPDLTLFLSLNLALEPVHCTTLGFPSPAEFCETLNTSSFKQLQMKAISWRDGSLGSASLHMIRVEKTFVFLLNNSQQSLQLFSIYKV